jgi:hypothetical protein
LALGCSPASSSGSSDDGGGEHADDGAIDAPIEPPEAGDGGAPEEASTQPDSGLPSGCTGAHPSFANDVTPIFKMSCAGAEICHNSLSGGSPWPYAALVNVHAQRDSCSAAGILVVPNDLGASYLMNKLTGSGMCPSTNRMPPSMMLPDAEIQVIADWICSGAQNN